MILKPQTWQWWPSVHLATTVTAVSILLTVAWIVLLLLTRDYDSTPPFVLATGTVTALAWVWRMQISRTSAELRADERLIGELRKNRADRAAREREEEAFREITRYFNKEC